MRHFYLLLAFLIAIPAYGQAVWNPEPGCVTVETAEELAVALDIVNEDCIIDLNPGDTLDMSSYKALDVANPGVKIRTRFPEYRDHAQQFGGAVLQYDVSYPDTDLEGFLFVISQPNVTFEGLTFIGPTTERGSYHDTVGSVGAIKFDHAYGSLVVENIFEGFPKWAVQYDGYQLDKFSANWCRGIQDEGYGYCVWLGPDGPVASPTSQSEVYNLRFEFNNNVCEGVRKCIDGSYRFTAEVRHNICIECFRSFFDIHEQNGVAGWYYSVFHNSCLDNRGLCTKHRALPLYYGEVWGNWTKNSCGAFAPIDFEFGSATVTALDNWGSVDNRDAESCN